MKKMRYAVLVVMITSLNSIYSMETIEQSTKIKDIIIYLASFCRPYQKNLLMKVCRSFNEYLKDRESVVMANPDLVSTFDKVKSIFFYAASGEIEKLRIWLEYLQEGDIGRINIVGQSAFHVAIEHNHTDIMYLLAEYGAPVNQNKLSIHPLHEAVYRNDKNMVNFLFGCNVHPNHIIYGATPLHIAAVAGNTDMIQLLLAHKPYIDATNLDDSTPLNIAADYGHIDIVELLINAKANINKPDCLGDTPLHSATFQGYIDIVKLLLVAGANMHLRNGRLETPGQIALHNQDPEMIKLFKYYQEQETLKKIRLNYNAFLEESPLGRTTYHYQKYLKSERDKHC
jgi:ankyrin repeat protein